MRLLAALVLCLSPLLGDPAGVRAAESSIDPVRSAMLAELEHREIAHAARFRAAAVEVLGGEPAEVGRQSLGRIDAALERERSARSAALAASMAALAERRSEQRALQVALAQTDERFAAERAAFSALLSELEMLSAERARQVEARAQLEDAVKSGAHPALARINRATREHNVRLDEAREELARGRAAYQSEVQAFLDWQAGARDRAEAADEAIRAAFEAEQADRRDRLLANRETLQARQGEIAAVLERAAGQLAAATQAARSAVARERDAASAALESVDARRRERFGEAPGALHRAGARWLAAGGERDEALDALFTASPGGVVSAQGRRAMARAYGEAVTAIEQRVLLAEGSDGTADTPEDATARAAWAAHADARGALQSLSGTEASDMDRLLAGLDDNAYAALVRARMRLLEGEFAAIRAQVQERPSADLPDRELQMRFRDAAAARIEAEREALAQADGFMSLPGGTAAVREQLLESVWRHWARPVPGEKGRWFLPLGLVTRN